MTLLQKYGYQLAMRDGGWVCHYCGCELLPQGVQSKWDRKIPLNAPQVDHKTPQKQGGTDDLDNLVLCCISCNGSKRALPYDEFTGIQHFDPYGVQTSRYQFIMWSIADDDMTPSQFRLYAHYMRRCTDRTYEESVRETARITQMTVGKVIKTRHWLERNGWIEIIKSGRLSLIIIVDKWKETFDRADKNDNELSDQ